MNAKTLASGIALLTVTLSLAAGAPGATQRASATLQLNAKFTVKWGGVDCAPGTPVLASCFRFVGTALVPGLGHVTETYTKTLETVGNTDCVRQIATAVVEVAGKGEIFVSTTRPELCGKPAPGRSGPYDLTITGGSRTYAGASGSVQFTSAVGAPRGGNATDTWIGALTVPGIEFELTPPAIQGAVSKTVRAPKNAKRIRVRYTVTAHDAVDGSVAVACAPRSGGFFQLGATKVTCSATDSSGNTRQTRFTVTVKRSRT